MLLCFNQRGEKERAKLLFKEESFINRLLKAGDRLLFDNEKQNVEKNKRHWEEIVMQWDRTCSFCK